MSRTNGVLHKRVSSDLSKFAILVIFSRHGVTRISQFGPRAARDGRLAGGQTALAAPAARRARDGRRHSRLLGGAHGGDDDEVRERERENGAVCDAKRNWESRVS